MDSARRILCSKVGSRVESMFPVSLIGFGGFCEGKHGGVRKLLRLPKEVSLGLLWRHFISPGLEV